MQGVFAERRCKGYLLEEYAGRLLLSHVYLAGEGLGEERGGAGDYRCSEGYGGMLA